MPANPQSNAPRSPRPAAPPRVRIEKVYPEIDAGRYPIKRILGDEVVVEASIFTDGHDVLRALLLHRAAGEAAWHETAMVALENDRWRGRFHVEDLKTCEYTLEAWVDRFGTWRHDMGKRFQAGHDVRVELLSGAELVEQAAERASGADADALARWASRLRAVTPDQQKAMVAEVLEPAFAALMEKYPDRRRAVRYARELRVTVDREKARCSAWYEMFPRSCSPEPARHGTFRDCEQRLPYIAGMGFDVLYLPPLHPIGQTDRKGKNNQPQAGPDDVGSPWAIGGAQGGHKAIHPSLGTPEDFRRLLAKAAEYGLEIALDLAFQATPDHPYVREHPAWFRWRPDGTVQYAENPPKKYQDIYPFEFENDDWESLWQELKSVVLHWAAQGVRIFRVDNPHTKPFAFWEWLIAEVKKDYPEAIFLSEAFTRPHVMYELAKLGFTQSYTYFAWRNTKWELTQYFTELTQTEVREYFRPNLWPNTPDILTEYLQFGGRPAFMARAVLAATLGANYGIYGPAFELMEARAVAPGKEEYLDSEKYELRHWDLERPDSLRPLLARLNRVRQANPALQHDATLRFHPVDNDHLIAYTKSAADNLVLVVVNLDPHHKQSGWLRLPLRELGLDPAQPYQLYDQLSEARFLWQGPRNFVELEPQLMPAHVFRVLRKARTERDFDYFM